VENSGHFRSILGVSRRGAIAKINIKNGSKSKAYRMIIADADSGERYDTRWGDGHGITCSATTVQAFAKRRHRDRICDHRTGVDVAVDGYRGVRAADDGL
jgi:hypothetical protein